MLQNKTTKEGWQEQQGSDRKVEMQRGPINKREKQRRQCATMEESAIYRRMCYEYSNIAIKQISIVWRKHKMRFTKACQSLIRQN